MTKHNLEYCVSEQKLTNIHSGFRTWTNQLWFGRSNL